MKAEIYKAIIRYPWQPVPAVGDDDSVQAILTRGMIARNNESCKWAAHATIVLWCYENNARGKVLNVYGNERGQIVVVLNDRDAALMLKLALS